jgi:hypothetical protein
MWCYCAGFAGDLEAAVQAAFEALAQLDDDEVFVLYIIH